MKDETLLKKIDGLRSDNFENQLAQIRDFRESYHCFRKTYDNFRKNFDKEK